MKNSNLKIVRQKYNTLLDKVNFLRKSYYNYNSSIVSDYEYDKLFSDLKEMEKKYPELINKNSATQQVGQKVDQAFLPVKHINRLYSLEDVFLREDLNKWRNRIENIALKDYEIKPRWLVELKIDGLAVNLQYKNGKLIHAITRGDGITGEDVTHNILHMSDIPKHVKDSTFPEFIEIRGEVYIPKHSFNKLNKISTSLGKQSFANARNAASGSLRQKDSSISAKRNLRFFPHGVGAINGKKYFSQHAIYQEFMNWGFTVSKLNKVYDSFDDVEKFIETYRYDRHNLDYVIDGIVIKVDQIFLQKKLGYTLRTPRWAIAFKYPAKKVHTQLLDIKVDVGRTGRITPYAILKPIKIDGSLISKATLHNQKFIQEREIRIYDTIILRKAGDIIPEIIGPVKELRTGKEKIFKMPTNCPSCDTLLGVEKKSDIDLRCLNSQHCLMQLRKRIQHLSSRNAFNIEILGEEAIFHITKKTSDCSPVLKSEADIFNLTLSSLKNIQFEKKEKNGNIKLSRYFWKFDAKKEKYFPSKNTIKLIDQLNLAKEKPFWRVLIALSIRHVGPKVAMALSSRFKSMEAIKKAKIQDFESLDGVGPTVAQSIIDWFSKGWHNAIIDNWTLAGIKMKSEEKNIKKIFEDSNIAVTGKFNEYTRESIKEAINIRGGRVSNSISQKTTAIIVGKNPGSKLEKAKKLNILQLTEDNFKNILNEETFL